MVFWISFFIWLYFQLPDFWIEFLLNMIKCGWGQVWSEECPQPSEWRRRWKRERERVGDVSLYFSGSISGKREPFSWAFSSSGSASGWTMLNGDNTFIRRRSSLSSRLLGLHDSRSGSYSRILMCLEAGKQVILEAGFIVLSAGAAIKTESSSHANCYINIPPHL